MAAPDAHATPALPPPPRGTLALAWVVFWALMMTVAVQDHLRQGLTDLWKPLLWEGTSFVVLTAFVAAQWRQISRLDPLLGHPARWAAGPLMRLPFIAVGFVVTVYALRHGVHAAVGVPYHHEPWATVFGYELVKFAIFYLLFIAIIFGIRSHAAMVVGRLLAQQAQLVQLAQQIEPHFLFNALNTIASTIHTDAALADRLLTRLAALLRAATDLARQADVTLDEELRLLEHYAAIMQQRFADRVTLRWDIDASARTCRVPALLLQPLLENAFRHGVERWPGPVQIAVAVRRRALRLQVVIEQDVGEIPSEPAEGVGLGNLRQRLALTYGERAALSLRARAGGGVTATIELPCDC